MKALAALLFASLIFVDEAPRAPTAASFRYSRRLAFVASIPKAVSSFGCAPLDADVFAHTNATMSDLRILGTQDGTRETPYVITMSGVSGSPEQAPILNLGTRPGNRLAFDLKMPSRPYSALDLHLDARDFIASANVEGMRAPHDGGGTFLGTFTLFDLSSQHLGKSAHLEIAESTFPYLHVELTFTAATGAHPIQVGSEMVKGAEIPASRLGQVPYTPVQTTSAIVQEARKSVATFKVPAHVPVERVSFEVDPADHTSFSRSVTISATPDKTERDALPAAEQVSGEISRVHVEEGNQAVRADSLSVDAVLGSNGQSSETIQVAVENGDDRPLSIKAMRLDMRERRLCFPALGIASEYQTERLFYGGDSIAAPVYDLGRLFDPTKPSVPVALGAEEANALYAPEKPANKPFTERHPAVLWVALLAAVAALGGMAFRSAKRL